MADLNDNSPWIVTDPNAAPAQRAKRKCREANRRENLITLEALGDVTKTAGRIHTFDASWGKFAGNYRLDRVEQIYTPKDGLRTRSVVSVIGSNEVHPPATATRTSSSNRTRTRFSFLAFTRVGPQGASHSLPACIGATGNIRALVHINREYRIYRRGPLA